jgi:hypothetical protein
MKDYDDRQVWQVQLMHISIEIGGRVRLYG